MHDGTVDGVVGGEEGVLAGDVACNVVPHDEEAGPLQVHVGVYVDEGVVAQCDAAVGVLLYGILVELRAEVGGFVLGEEGAAGTKESHIYNLGSYGCYWSSEDDTIGYNDFHFASGLSINNKGYSVSGIGGAWRLMGCSVRAVYIDK